MSTERTFVLGVDLDGCVADFYGALRQIAAEWKGVPSEQLPAEVSYGLPEWGFDSTDDAEYQSLHRFAVAQRGLFSPDVLTPIVGAPAALRRIEQTGVRIRIITHRLYVKFLHEEAVVQTVRWLDYFGIPYWDLCFMKQKGEVGAHLYIEDSPSNVRALREAGKTVIVFANSTNREEAPPRAETWEEVEKIVTEHVERWGPEASRG